MSTDPNAVTRVQFDGNGNVVDPSSANVSPTLPQNNTPARSYDNTSRVQMGEKPTGPQKTGAPILVASRNGMNVAAAQARDSDTVIVHGVEVDIQSGILAGLITRLGDGTVVPLISDGETEASSQEQSQPQDEPAKDWRVDDALPEQTFVDPQVEAIFKAVETGVTGSTIARAHSEVLEGGEVSRGTIIAAASELGADPRAVADVAARVESHMRAQADAVMINAGLEPEVVWAWAQTEAPEALKEAVTHHLQRRTTAGYRALAETFYQNLDKIDPSAIRNARLDRGFSVRNASDGTLLIVTPQGQELTWQEALAYKLVRKA